MDGQSAFESRRQAVKTVSFAASSEDLDLIARLTKKFGIATSDILRMGIRLLAEKEGVAA